MDTQTPHLLADLVTVLIALGLIATIVLTLWHAYKNRQIERFCADELDAMPWGAAVTAFNSGKVDHNLIAQAQLEAAQTINNSVLAKYYDAKELANVRRSWAKSRQESNIVGDPLAMAVYERVTNLCCQARNKLSPFGQSVESVRKWLAAQIEAVIIEETRRAGATISNAEIEEFKNLSADDSRFTELTDRWINGG